MGPRPFHQRCSWQYPAVCQSAWLIKSHTPSASRLLLLGCIRNARRWAQREPLPRLFAARVALSGQAQRTLRASWSCRPVLPRSTSTPRAGPPRSWSSRWRRTSATCNSCRIPSKRCVYRSCSIWPTSVRSRRAPCCTRRPSTTWCIGCAESRRHTSLGRTTIMLTTVSPRLCARSTSI